jgi:hypothetical protein
VCLEPDLAGLDVDAVLYEFARVLDEDGLLIIRTTTAEPLGRSLRSAVVAATLEKLFAHVTVLRQDDWIVSTLQRDGVADQVPLAELLGSDHDLFARRAESADALVLASNVSLAMEHRQPIATPIEISVWRDTWIDQFEAVNRATARAAAAESKTAERDYLMRELFLAEQSLTQALDVGYRLEAADAEVQRCREQLKRCHEQLRRDQRDKALMTERLIEVQSQIPLLIDAVESANGNIRDLKASTSWRVTRPLRRFSDALRSTDVTESE